MSISEKNATFDLLWQWVCYLENGGPRPWTVAQWLAAVTPAK